MYSRYFIDHITQQIAALHAVIDAAEHSRDHISAVVAVRTGEPPQIGEEPWSLLTVRSACFILIDECEKLITRNLLRIGSPIAPSIRRLDGSTKLLPAKLRLFFALLLKVIHKFEKHDPGEERQPVKIAV